MLTSSSSSTRNPFLRGEDELKTLDEQKAELARSSIVLSEARSLLAMLEGREALPLTDAEDGDGGSGSASKAMPYTLAAFGHSGGSSSTLSSSPLSRPLTETMLQQRAQMTVDEIKQSMRKGGAALLAGGEGTSSSLPANTLLDTAARKKSTVDATRVYELCLDGLLLTDIGIPPATTTTATTAAASSSSSLSVSSPLQCYTSLRKLTLNFNKLTASSLSPAIVRTVFAALKELRELGLEFNSIDKDTLLVPLAAACQRLETLSLHHNQLTTIAPLTAAAFPKLASLDISHNKLTTFAAAKLRLPCLTSLDINHNNFTTLEALSSLTRLTSLNASHNALTSLQGIEGMVYLEELNAAHNNLKYTPTMQHSNPLRTVGRGKLLQMDLSFNKISSLGFFPPPNSCDNLKSVWSVNLSHNGFGSSNIAGCEGGGGDIDGAMLLLSPSDLITSNNKDSVPVDDVGSSTYGQDSPSPSRKRSSSNASSASVASTAAMGGSKILRGKPGAKKASALVGSGSVKVSGGGGGATPPPVPLALSVAAMGASSAAGMGKRPPSSSTIGGGGVAPSPEAPSSFLARLAGIFPNAEVIDLSFNGTVVPVAVAAASGGDNSSAALPSSSRPPSAVVDAAVNSITPSAATTTTTTLRSSIMTGYQDLLQLVKMPNLTELSLEGTFDHEAALLKEDMEKGMAKGESVGGARPTTGRQSSSSHHHNHLLQLPLSLKERHKAAVLSYLPNLTVLNKAPIAGTALHADTLVMDAIGVNDTLEQVLGGGEAKKASGGKDEAAKAPVAKGVGSKNALTIEGGGEGGSSDALSSSRPHTAARPATATSAAAGDTVASAKLAASERMQAIEAAKAREALVEVKEAMVAMVVEAQVSQAKCLALAQHMSDTMQWSLNVSRLKHQREREKAMRQEEVKRRVDPAEGCAAEKDQADGGEEDDEEDDDDKALPPPPQAPDMDAIEARFVEEQKRREALLKVKAREDKHASLLAEALSIVSPTTTPPPATTGTTSATLSTPTSAQTARLGGVGIAFTLKDAAADSMKGEGRLSAKERRRMGGDSSSDEEAEGTTTTTTAISDQANADGLNNSRPSTPTGRSAVGGGVCNTDTNSTRREFAVKDQSPRAKMLLQQDEQRRLRMQQQQQEGSGGDSLVRPASVPTVIPSAGKALNKLNPSMGLSNAQIQKLGGGGDPSAEGGRNVSSAQTTRSSSKGGGGGIGKGVFAASVGAKTSAPPVGISSFMMGGGVRPLASSLSSTTAQQRRSGSIGAAPPSSSASSTTTSTATTTTAAMAKVKAQHATMHPMAMKDVKKALEKETDAKKRELIELMGAMGEAEERRGGGGGGNSSKEVDRRSSSSSYGVGSAYHYPSSASGMRCSSRVGGGNMTPQAVRKPSAATTLLGNAGGVDAGVGTNNSPPRASTGGGLLLKTSSTSMQSNTNTLIEWCSMGIGTDDVDDNANAQLQPKLGWFPNTQKDGNYDGDDVQTTTTAALPQATTDRLTLAGDDNADDDDDDAASLELNAITAKVLAANNSHNSNTNNTIDRGVPSIANINIATAMRTGVVEAGAGSASFTVKGEEGEGNADDDDDDDLTSKSMVPYFEKESKIFASADPRGGGGNASPILAGGGSRNAVNSNSNTNTTRPVMAQRSTNAPSTTGPSTAATSSNPTPFNNHHHGGVDKREANRRAMLMAPSSSSTNAMTSSHQPPALAMDANEEKSRGATAVQAEAKSRDAFIKHLEEEGGGPLEKGAALQHQKQEEEPTFYKPNTNIAATAAPVVVSRSQGGSLNARRRK